MTEKPNTSTELRQPSYPVRIHYGIYGTEILSITKLFSNLLPGVRSPAKYKNEGKSDSVGDV